MKKIDFYAKHIGIWGFGIVGQAALRFFSDQRSQCTVFDQKKSDPDDLAPFLNTNEYILPSPGIDLRPYMQYQHKFLAEADIFSQFWHKPIIAITGSVGKTTVTTLLAQIMEAADYRVAVGGNIGIGMLDLVADQDKYDYAILELSSFQLELCRSFAPNLAIWTNFYPNHLDRHGSVKEYFAAKMNILKGTGKALVGEDVWEKISRKNGFDSTSLRSPRAVSLVSAYPAVPGIAFGDAWERNEMKSKGHPANWQTIIQAIELLNIPLPDLSKINFKLPEHRLEKVATINGVTFYNDSKATIAEATLAAVEQLHPPSRDKRFGVIQSNIILLLGGLSKGVDRKPLIAKLVGRVKQVVAFGMEADAIEKLCNQEALNCISCPTLEMALDEAIQKAKPGDQILLSPGGASFDLFSDYKSRGSCFKKLVSNFNRG